MEFESLWSSEVVGEPILQPARRLLRRSVSGVPGGDVEVDDDATRPVEDGEVSYYDSDATRPVGRGGEVWFAMRPGEFSYRYSGKYRLFTYLYLNSYSVYMS